MVRSGSWFIEPDVSSTISRSGGTMRRPNFLMPHTGPSGPGPMSPAPPPPPGAPPEPPFGSPILIPAPAHPTQRINPAHNPDGACARDIRTSLGLWLSVGRVAPIHGEYHRQPPALVLA